MKESMKKISKFMGDRTWQTCYKPLLEEDPTEAREEAYQVMKKAGLRLSKKELVGLLDEVDCPICAAEGQQLRLDPKNIGEVFKAQSTFWNHSPRKELEGYTPVEHLKERLLDRPDEEPLKIAEENVDMISLHRGQEFFSNMPDPSELGLCDEFMQILEEEPAAGFEELSLEELNNIDGVTITKIGEADPYAGIPKKIAQLERTDDYDKGRARNMPCFCGSGKKIKRCCGRGS